MTSIFLLAMALSMDGFLASLALSRSPHQHRLLALQVGLFFGLAQSAMAALGWVIGSLCAHLLGTVGAWLAMMLLGLLGGRMIWQGFRGDPRTCQAQPRGSLTALALVTSMDAAVAGVSLPLLGNPMWLDCVAIALITASISVAGVAIGRAASAQLGKSAEIIGGFVLLGLGLKVFLQQAI